MTQKATPPPKSKKKKPTSPFRQKLKSISPFAIACTVVALGYIGYRTVSLAGPNGLGAIFSSNQQLQPVEIGCNQDVDLELPVASDQLPLLSESYQQFIQRQKATSDNLIKNFSLEDVDTNSAIPKGYYHITEADYIKYEFLREDRTNVPFLRAETNRKVNSNELAGGWITNPIAVNKNQSYVYSFAYRTTVPLTVSVEYTMPNGSIVYDGVTNLHRSDNWSRFTNYFDNQRGATAFRFIAVSREEGQIDLRDYTAYSVADASLQAGMVSITFDDGWQSIAKNGIPILNKYGFKTSQYIISEASDKKVADYMDMATLQQLKAEGHEIGSHTLTHCDQTKLSSMDILKNARDSKKELERNNLGPITSYAYPYGRYNDTAQQLVAGAYSFMRTSDTGYNDRYFDSRNIKSRVVLDTTTDKEFQDWLDYAKANHLWLVIAYHRVDEHGSYSVTSAQLDRQLQMIKQSEMAVVPLSKAAKDIRQ